MSDFGLELETTATLTSDLDEARRLVTLDDGERRVVLRANKPYELPTTNL